MPACPGCGFKKNDPMAQHCKRCSLHFGDSSSWERAEPQIRLAVVGYEEEPTAEPQSNQTIDKLRGYCDVARKQGILTMKGAVLIDQVLGFIDRQVLADPEPAVAIERAMQMFGQEQTRVVVEQARTVFREAGPQASQLLHRLSATSGLERIEGLFEEVLPQG